MTLERKLDLYEFKNDPTEKNIAEKNKVLQGFLSFHSYPFRTICKSISCHRKT